MFREVGIAGRALALLGAGVLTGCDCYLSDGTPDASVDASVDAGVETDAAFDAGPEEECPGGEPSFRPEETVETHEEGCWTVTDFGHPAQNDRRDILPEVALGGDGTVHILHNRLQSPGEGDLHHGRSRHHVTNAGGIWQYEILDCVEHVGEWEQEAELAVAPSGAVYITGTRAPDAASPFDGVYLLTNESGAWVIDHLELFAQAAGLAVSATEETHVSAAGSLPEPKSGLGDLLFGRREASGEWMTEVLPRGGPYAGKNAELAVAGDGAAYVLSVNVCPGGPEQLEDCLRGEGPEVWGLELATNESGEWTVSTIGEGRDLANTHPRLALGPGGDVHCAYPSSTEDEVTGSLVYGVRREGTWSFESVADDLGDAMSLALAVDGDGAAHLIYASPRADDPEEPLIHYVTNRSGEWVSESVPVPGGDRSLPSLVIGPDGRVHLALDLGSLVYATRACP